MAGRGAHFPAHAGWRASRQLISGILRSCAAPLGRRNPQSASASSPPSSQTRLAACIRACNTTSRGSP
jgi:hypothetical protein